MAKKADCSAKRLCPPANGASTIPHVPMDGLGRLIELSNSNDLNAIGAKETLELLDSLLWDVHLDRNLR